VSIPAVTGSKSRCQLTDNWRWVSERLSIVPVAIFIICVVEHRAPSRAWRLQPKILNASYFSAFV
jgi:hypothetical protein